MSKIKRFIKFINESKLPSKNEILKPGANSSAITNIEKGIFSHFRRDIFGDIICSFSTDDSTPNGLRRVTRGIKVKNLNN